MNNPHQNARTTRLGRAEMIRRILEDGQPIREVARGFGISERTARKWLARYRTEGPSGLDNRSSCPRTVANRTGEYWIGVVEMLRREYRLTADDLPRWLTWYNQQRPHGSLGRRTPAQALAGTT